MPLRDADNAKYAAYQRPLLFTFDIALALHRFSLSSCLP